MNPNPTDNKAAQQAAQALSKEAEARGEMVLAERWRQVAESYGPIASISPQGDIEPAAVAPAQQVQQPAVSEPGYYYLDAGTNQWVPTTQSDAAQRKQAGQQVVEPRQ